LSGYSELSLFGFRARKNPGTPLREIREIYDRATHTTEPKLHGNTASRNSTLHRRSTNKPKGETVGARHALAARQT